MSDETALATETVREWRQTACILCECNCGVEVRLGADGKTFDRIRGDKSHPASKGYTCEKALRLDYYQNGRGERLLSDPYPPGRRARHARRNGRSLARDAARSGRAEFSAAFAEAMGRDPRLAAVAPIVRYRSLGETLPHGAAAAAALWPMAVRCAQINPDGVARAGFGTGPDAGNRLFDAIVDSPSGVVFTDDTWDATWARLKTDDGAVHLGGFATGSGSPKVGIVNEHRRRHRVLVGCPEASRNLDVGDGERRRA